MCFGSNNGLSQTSFKILVLFLYHNNLYAKCWNFLLWTQEKNKTECETVYETVEELECHTTSDEVCTTEYKEECEEIKEDCPEDCETVYDIVSNVECSTIEEQQCRPRCVNRPAPPGTTSLLLCVCRYPGNLDKLQIKRQINSLNCLQGGVQ